MAAPYIGRGRAGGPRGGRHWESSTRGGGGAGLGVGDTGVGFGSYGYPSLAGAMARSGAGTGAAEYGKGPEEYVKGPEDGLVSALRLPLLTHLMRAAVDAASADAAAAAAATAAAAAAAADGGSGSASASRAAASPPVAFRRGTISEAVLDQEIRAVLSELREAGEDPHEQAQDRILSAVIARVDGKIALANEQAEVARQMEALAPEDVQSLYTPETLALDYFEYLHETGRTPAEVPPALYLDQLGLECKAVSAAVQRYQEMSQELTNMGKAAQLRPAQHFVVSWFAPLTQAIEAEQSMVREKLRGRDRRVYGPYLLMLGAPELACIVMHELLNRILMAPQGVRFAEVAVAVGKAVNAEVNLTRIRQNRQDFSRLTKQYPGGRLTTPIVMTNASRMLSDSTWTEVVRAKVGSALLHIMLSSATAASPDHRGGKARARSAQQQQQGGAASDAGSAAAAPTAAAPGDATAPSPSPSAGKGDAEAGAEDDGSDPYVTATALEHADASSPPSRPASSAASAAAAAAPSTGTAGAGAGADGEAAGAAVPAGDRAFLHEFVTSRSGQTIGIIRCDRRVLNVIEEGHAFVAELGPRLLPMVMPPRPWRSHREGGYVSVPTQILRTKGSQKQTEAVGQAEIPHVLDALNYLGRVPWRINETVLAIIHKYWSMGGGVAEMPSRIDIPPLREPPIAVHDETTPEGQQSKAEEKAAWKKWTKDMETVAQLNYDLHSLRCDTELKLAQADELAGRDIYFPFNLDFRGRAYPIPPHLNHLGSDLARGLLLFAQAKPLGPTGLYWLYAHLASQFGVDKVSLDDRVAYSKSKLDLIRASVRDPFECNTPNPIIDKPDPMAPPLPYRQQVPWWQTADAPWQALATCFEIVRAIDSGNPETYACALPVHQDGSCNGLQHYAALGRDELGGSRVNLLPADKPQDVYTHVLNQVKVLMREDVERGHPMAEELLKHVSRKVVKQTVMTSVYGVTFVGAREQIAKQLKDLKGVEWPEPAESSIYQASVYLAKLTLGSLSTVFVGAKSIMTWLGECAHLMATQHQPVSWVTPMGLPVTQPYRKASAFQVRTLMQNLTFTDNNDALPVSSQRQRAAFPPNFVHSLDATHMMLTALECERKGLVFSSVHDSFWTHACDVPIMNECLRDQFIALYSQPVLEELHQSFVTRFPHVNFPPVPNRGTLDLERIRESQYFFS